MANVDYSKMSLNEMLELQTDLSEAIENKRVSEKKQLLEQFQEQAKESGFELSELFEDLPKNQKPKKPVSPKYQNPDNPEEKWAGRGKRPAWFTACLEKGLTEDDLKI